MKFTSEQLETKELNQIDAETWHEILKLRSKVFVAEQQCIYLDPDDSDHQATHVFIKSDRDVLAYTRVYSDGPWHIGRVICDPSCRNQGVASLMMRHCLEFIAKHDRSQEVELSAQVYLSDFYKRHGFSPVGRMYLEDGIPHVRMVYSPNG